MKIISWNMGFWEFAEWHTAAWDYLIHYVQPDIALLQETAVPERYVPNTVFRPRRCPSREEKWGTAIYVNPESFSLSNVQLVDETDKFLTASPENSEDCFNGKTVITSVLLKDVCLFNAVSIHTNTNTAKYGSNDDITVRHLDYLFKTNKLHTKLGSYFIIGGDFNADQTMYENAYSKYFSYLEGEGLHECLKPVTQTFFGWNMSKENHFQDDHVFIPKIMAKQIKKCFAWNYGKIKHLSDHTIVELELEGSEFGI